MERGYIINASILRDACLDKINALQSKTLCQIFDEYLAGQSDAVGISISTDTFYNYSRTLVLLKEYMRQKFDRADIALQELNYSFIEGFNTFLRKEYSQRKNTAVKYLRCLKRVVNIAIANRYLKFDPFLNFKVQREVVDKVFLTEEELRRIINKDFAIKRLERVRDIFIFCCFTGLSYSDVKTLDRSHFETDEAGRIWIKKHRVKTGVLFRVPLLPIPKLILEKYKGGEKMLPVIDLSSTDAYLKEIADLCGIDKRISFHTARFTFATTVTITNKISLEVVSKMMGHTNTRMTSHKWTNLQTGLMIWSCSDLLLRIPCNQWQIMGDLLFIMDGIWYIAHLVIYNYIIKIWTITLNLTIRIYLTIHQTSISLLMKLGTLQHLKNLQNGLPILMNVNQ